jgi:hypothetical protein
LVTADERRWTQIAGLLGRLISVIHCAPNGDPFKKCVSHGFICVYLCLSAV